MKCSLLNKLQPCALHPYEDHSCTQCNPCTLCLLLLVSCSQGRHLPPNSPSGLKSCLPIWKDTPRNAARKKSRVTWLAAARGGSSCGLPPCLFTFFWSRCKSRVGLGRLIPTSHFLPSTCGAGPYCTSPALSGVSTEPGMAQGQTLSPCAQNI